MRDLPPEKLEAQSGQALGDGREIVAHRPDAARQQVRHGKVRLADERPQHRPHRTKRFVNAQRVGNFQQPGVVLHDAGEPPGAVGIEGHHTGERIGHDRHGAEVFHRAHDLLAAGAARRKRSSSVSKKFQSRSAAAESSSANRKSRESPSATCRQSGPP